ncbi:MAG: DNA repair protein RecN [Pseudomonadales bacterium]|nr:DNA repair protein RecN [Pseudomonadales bacterium]
MLKQLTLKNFVLVEALDIDFNVGFTTITGESGAGKSILLSALGLLLGERANTEAIRPGAAKADVSAEFDLSKLPALQTQLASDELEGDEPTQCLVRRVVSNQGRSRAFVNGVPVTTQYLRHMGQQLVEVHGQNEHQSLSNRTNQLSMLDDFAGLANKVDKVRKGWVQWQNALQKIAELEAALNSAANRKDLLTYQLDELQTLALAAGEFERVDKEHKRLANAQTTLESLFSASQALEDVDPLRQASSALETIQDDHDALVSARANLTDALSLIDDAVHDLRQYQELVVIDPEALRAMEDRLNAVLDLARKHRVEAYALHHQTDLLQEELDGLEADDSTLLSLTAELDELEATYRKAAKTLSNARRKAAPKFAAMVGHYMQLLGIGDGAFAIEFEDVEWELGTERVTYMVTTNPNFPAGSLTQIASGGEQTRIALAIQIVAAEHSALPCLILDEADVGVGGTTADTVGRILRNLGTHTQVICITHAPQVAALGNNHFRVTKQDEHTDIENLDDAHRIDELARMLAGSGITDQTRDYAASLLKASTEEPH